MQNDQDFPEIEKRLYTRVKTKIPVHYRVWDSEVATMKTLAVGKSYTFDVSQGGMRLPIGISHKLLGPIDLEFEAHSRIQAKGRIRWFHRGDEKDKLELGVEFTKIENGDRYKLLLFGYQQQQKSSEPGAA
jgi:c-di-GMP-binding flagellar brake protein YcgR